jgi:hypothetical protein
VASAALSRVLTRVLVGPWPLQLASAFLVLKAAKSCVAFLCAPLLTHDITEETRAFGLPTIRADRTAPKLRSVANAQVSQCVVSQCVLRVIS